MPPDVVSENTARIGSKGGKMKYVLAASLIANFVLGISLWLRPSPLTPAEKTVFDFVGQVLATTPAPIRPAREKLPNCDKTWAALKESWPVEESEFELQDCEGVPEELRSAHEAALENCRKAPRTPSALFIQCDLARRDYKNRLVVWENHGKSNADVTDARVLVARFDTASTPLSGGNPDYRTMLEVAARLSELRPDRTEPAMMVLQSVYGFVGEESPDLSPEVWQRADEAFATLRRLTPDDPDLEEYALFVKSRHFQPELFQPMVEKYNRENPHSGLAYYYQATAAWRGGNVALAKEYLAEALKREPRDRRYRMTNDHLNQGGQYFFDPPFLNYAVDALE